MSLKRLVKRIGGWKTISMSASMMIACPHDECNGTNYPKRKKCCVCGRKLISAKNETKEKKYLKFRMRTCPRCNKTLILTEQGRLPLHTRPTNEVCYNSGLKID